MNQKKCDRCGKEITKEENTGLFASIANAMVEIANIVTKKPDYLLHDKRNHIDVDLCPACQKSLEEWMRNGKREKHPEGVRQVSIYAISDKKPEDITFGDF